MCLCVCVEIDKVYNKMLHVKTNFWLVHNNLKSQLSSINDWNLRRFVSKHNFFVVLVQK